MKPLRSITCLLLAACLPAGADTRVRIEGLQRKSEGQVLDLMAGRLEHVHTKPASSSRADDAAFLVRQVLLKDGYSRVSVSWRVVSRDEIVLTVDEGLRSSLGAVNITGVDAAEARRLSRLFSRPAVKDRPLGSGDPPFREDDVEAGLGFIVQDFQAKGYWTATAVETGRVMDPATGEVSIDIHVEPGPRHSIAKARVSSTDGRGVVRVATTVEPYIGSNATTKNLNAMRADVEEAFISRGYPDATILMGRSLENGRFIAEFSIDLGVRVRLNQVHVVGLEKTQPKRIERRMKKLEGEWYDEAAMNKRLRELLATGAFSSARVETSNVTEKRIDATLHFTEARAREVTLAAGVGSYEGAIARVTYTDRNLFGWLMGFSTGFEFSMRGVLGETRLTDPWFFGSDYSMTSRIFAMNYGHEGYESFESGADVTFSRKFGDHYSMELLGGWSLVNTSGDGLPPDALGETVYTHPRLRFTQTLDYRDNPILPTNGWLFQLPVQIGAAVGDISTSYVKADISGSWYHELDRHYQISLGARAGMLIPSGDGTDLPIGLRYFNGGARSIRSFPERELGPQANGYATGGEAYWVANAELVRTIAGPLKGVVFFDTGTLARDYDQLGSADLEMAAGLGVRLDLPIGPVRFEYGHNLTQDPGEPSGAFHFAIGAAF